MVLKRLAVASFFIFFVKMYKKVIYVIEWESGIYVWQTNCFARRIIEHRKSWLLECLTNSKSHPISLRNKWMLWVKVYYSDDPNKDERNEIKAQLNKWAELWNVLCIK